MLASTLWALCLQSPAPLAPLPQAPPPLRLKIGDGIRVAVDQRGASPFDGVYFVADDGAIYGSGFGRLKVVGMPFAEAERRIRVGLRPFVRPEFVFVRLESRTPDAIYLVGGSNPGRTTLVPGLTLRKVLPQTDAANWDLAEVELVRDGKRVLRQTLGYLFRNQDAALDAPLVAEDVISVVPVETLRVWVAGDVTKPGEMRMGQGTTLSQLLAEAGGLTGGRLDRDRVIRLRRGPDERALAYDGGQVVGDVPIQAGDLVTVTTAPPVKVTVTGEAAQQGEYVLEENVSLVTAIAKAGGANTTGTLKNVIVLRDGEAIRVDASDPLAAERSAGGRLKNGDLIVIPRNQNRFYVLGEVGHSGSFTMDENRTYRLSDAIGLASGLNDRGVLRRITVVRPGPDGRPKPTQYNLDEFLKDGKLESNPLLQPGDAIYVGTSKGLTLTGVTRAVSSLILVEALGGGR